ncbi:MAG TPA: DUF4124 domain-containing protein [Casimicrobiaceae bacterium]|nr:DUF4124 domain-containing protein [Casimicrobiaceae bacterium]
MGLLLALSGASAASGVTLAEKAKESGCVSKPVYVTGEMYKCATQSGASSYFNVPGAGGSPLPGSATSSQPVRSAKAATPAGFPRVDADTQKGRDDVRRKVLSDELAAEEKLLTESRTLYADGAPPPLPEEKADADKYRARIARLRQTVSMHEKNIEALKKELAAIK